MERFNEIQQSFISSRTKSQNMQSHVLVPIIQNLIGGLSIGLLYFFYLSKGIYYLNSPHILTAFILALIIASGFNIIRFFGDELGLFYMAFRMGQLFSPINGQMKESKQIIQKLTTNNTAYDNAIKLLVAHYYYKLPVTQENSKTSLKLTRQEYEDARAVLIQSGLMKNTRTNQLTPKTKLEALQQFKNMERKKNE